MTRSHYQLSTTIIRLMMDPPDQAEYNRLQGELSRQRQAREDPGALRRTIHHMLDVAAAPKASALEGLALHIKKDQTIVFSRNQAEQELVLAACRNAGKTLHQLTACVDDHGTWTEDGGVLAAVIGPHLRDLNLLQAKRCIYFSRPTNIPGFIRLKARLHHRDRRTNLEETHLVTLHSADNLIANALMTRIWNR